MFEVVGYEDDGAPIVMDVEDEVEGDVMGYQGPMGDVVGARRRRRRAHASQIQVHRPRWRDTQLAPGVIAPDQGMLPLTLNGSAGTNTFSAAVTAITFQGQLQKPFRGERLLVNTVRVGASSTGRLIGQLFVGTDLQQVVIAGFDLEQVGNPGAFGVRLTMKPAQPGVFISIVTTLTSALAGTDTISATVTLLGRVVH
jgi:hypothetical protein